MKKNYYVFVTVTFIIVCFTRISRSAYNPNSKLLLAHNPRCGYSTDKLLRMNTTTPFSFDPSTHKRDWNRFFDQNHSYVDPAYMPNEWALNPPKKVLFKIDSYDRSSVAITGSMQTGMTFEFDSTGKTPTNWLDGDRVLRSPKGSVPLTVVRHNNLLMIGPANKDVYWVMSDVRAEENDQIIFLQAKKARIPTRDALARMKTLTIF
ncbi:hypothetical protein KP79_PYT20298 [Mizuhopecten yessoensis]|uniref:Uncharacterized protein n=1 Tax=Mizuhopecten yessoensis TaxID=6573 RepID=A0A210PRY0_MIZYE|nr:hypothetical protein KP79_PYT20298 [Mizuhopecten yessoensis]